MKIDKSRLLLIGGAIAVMGIMILLTWYGFTREKPAVQTAEGVTYTDSISGQELTGFPTTGTAQEDGKADTPPSNEIIITGLDDFFATINQDQARSILDDITAFIRAHAGAQSTRAGALNARITKTMSNPATYTFTLVLVNPSVRYPVTITMPFNDTATADVSFGRGEVAQ
jgi:hypothetical protein